jgi:hypothetical protein
MKTICIYHSRDLDGWMSAAIVKQWYINVYYPKVTDFGRGIVADEGFSSLDFLGWDYGDNIPNLSDYDKVIMCDISFPKEEMLNINVKLGTNFVWIDHHRRTIDEVNEVLIAYGIPMEGLVTLPNELKAACELTWEYFFPNEEMPEIVRLLGRYDCFGHKGTKEEKKVLEFQYGARQAVGNYSDAYEFLLQDIRDASSPGVQCWSAIWDNGKIIYKYLCTEATQSYKKAFPVEFFEPIDLVNESMNYPLRKFLCVNQERFNPINFGIDYHKDGYDGFACFWYQNGEWTFSLYNDNGEIDCSAIAKQYGGGGHKGAAGFRTKNIYDIIGRD